MESLNDVYEGVDMIKGSLSSAYSFITGQTFTS